MKVVFFGVALVATLAGCGKQNEAQATAAQANAPASAPAPSKPKGATWELVRSKDEMTDVQRVSAQLVGVDGGDSNTLLIRCEGRRLEALSTFDQFLGNDSRPVKYRVDQNPPRDAEWSVSAKGTAVFAAEGADFARQLIAAKRVLIEATDFRSVAHRATYEWTAGGEKIGAVLQACGLAIEGLDMKVPGLRKATALEIERWGPKNIQTRKQALAAVAGFKGEIDGQMTPDFALAAQAFHDDYVGKCRSGKVRGGTCDTIKILAKINPEDLNWSVGSVIYEMAPKPIKKEIGGLRIYD